MRRRAAPPRSSRKGLRERRERHWTLAGSPRRSGRDGLGIRSRAMPRALEIPIEVTRLDRAVDSVRQFAGSIRGVGNASETAAERSQRSWTRAMEKITRDQERYTRVPGPAARLQRAQAAQQAAMGSG